MSTTKPTAVHPEVHPAALVVLASFNGDASCERHGQKTDQRPKRIDAPARTNGEGHRGDTAEGETRFNSVCRKRVGSTASVTAGSQSSHSLHHTRPLSLSAATSRSPSTCSSSRRFISSAFRHVHSSRDRAQTIASPATAPSGALPAPAGAVWPVGAGALFDSWSAMFVSFVVLAGIFIFLSVFETATDSNATWHHLRSPN
jgi:hypothetical protein